MVKGFWKNDNRLIVEIKFKFYWKLSSKKDQNDILM